MNSLDIAKAVRGDAEMLEAFGGVLSCDHLRRLGRSLCLPSERPLFYIVNSRPARSEGEHWLLIYLPEEGLKEFFDPLGRSPEYYSKYFKEFLERKHSQYLCSNRPVQPPGSDTCGDFCLYYAARRVRGESMLDIIESFRRDNLWFNHFMVRQYSYQLRFQ